ncbi:hypothetical protein JQS43_07725 [Natronosporangium hydrolyticum]|uniref:MFS transporter n=1 Tax=Natronosporangium hydrolyticum TaxID=2811111 RepID=A0A895YEF4_9ACTN|nr:hypothetical protein [Natronosporangium hydrolyticum]QSB16177.1 hypothetical protein JQS43_07725 [Natronosporangium hydrolyticum]
MDAAVCTGQVALGFLVATFGAYLAVLADELERPRGELVWVTSTFGGGLVLAAVLGPTVLRVGAGRLLRLGAFATAVGAIGMAATPVLPVAGTGSVLVGLGCAAIVLVTPALLAGPDAARRLTRAVAAASAGGVCAPMVIGALQQVGVSGRWGLLAPVPVLIIAAARRVVPDRGVPAAHQQMWGAAVTDAPRVVAAPATIGWLRIVLAVAAEFCFVVWAVSRLQDTGASLGAASVLSTGFVLGMAVGRLGGIRIAQWPGALVLASLVAMTGTVVVFVGDDPIPVTVGITIASLGIALLYPITLAQLVAVPGLRPRHAASIGSLASGSAVLAAPAVLAWLDGAIGLRLAFLLPIPLLLLLVVLSPRQRRQEPV